VSGVACQEHPTSAVAAGETMLRSDGGHRPNPGKRHFSLGVPGHQVGEVERFTLRLWGDQAPSARGQREDEDDALAPEKGMRRSW
jgi:hypothetical protein